MSICTGVIVAVTFQKIDCTPDSKTCTECYYESLQYADCAVEKCHSNFLLARILNIVRWTCGLIIWLINNNAPLTACAPADGRA